MDTTREIEKVFSRFVSKYDNKIFLARCERIRLLMHHKIPEDIG
jgi:hypothetical protein